MMVDDWATIPPLWYPLENFTKLPPLAVLVVPDSVEQLVAHSNLKTTRREGSKTGLLIHAKKIARAAVVVIV